MAEGFWTKLNGGEWESFSGGSNPAGFVHPLAIEVMGEVGIDMSSNESKHVRDFADQPFDLVIAVCGGAKEACPTFPGTRPFAASKDTPSRAARLP